MRDRRKPDPKTLCPPMTIQQKERLSNSITHQDLFWTTPASSVSKSTAPHLVPTGKNENASDSENSVDLTRAEEFRNEAIERGKKR